MTDKNCPKCQQSFNTKGSYCKPCEVIYRRKLRQADRNKAQLHKIRDRAKQKNIEFSLTLEDLMIPEFCPVLHIRLERGSNMDAWPSVDRIDPTKGYTKDNIVVVSFLANKIKNNATIEQLRQVYEFYKKYT